MQADYKPAGIFQFSQVQKLIHQSEDEYTPLEYPIALPKFREHLNFGAEMKDNHFLLDKSWTFINHGAFGAVLKECLQASELWRIYCERQPLRFIDREMLPHLVHALRKLAKFIDSDPADVVFISNATTGINAIVRSLVKTYQPGDSIFMLDITYGTVKTLLQEVTKENKLRLDEIALPSPLQSSDEILKIVEASLRPDTKLAVFDHIPSNHCYIMPIKELVEMCHQRGIQVLIDGAHALGSVKLSMRNIGADFYVANGHKWLCSPKGTAFLYVNRHCQSLVHPLVISWGYGEGFTSEFTWTASLDYTPYLSVLTVLDFWAQYGQENMIEYMYRTVKTAGELLQRVWQTRLLANATMFGPMVVVKLPERVLSPSAGFKPPYDDRAAHAVMNVLHYEFKIEVPVRIINGEMYVRLSAHVYNEVHDFEILADAVLDIVKRNSTSD